MLSLNISTSLHGAGGVTQRENNLMVLKAMTHRIFQNEGSGKEIRVVMPGCPVSLALWPHLQVPFINHKRQ